MKIGSLVVCIDDKNWEPESLKFITTLPVKDEIYTLRDISITRRGSAVWLEEIYNPPCPHPSGLGTMEPSFKKERFREVSPPMDVQTEVNKVWEQEQMYS